MAKITFQGQEIDLGPLASLEDLPTVHGKDHFKWRGQMYHKSRLPPEVMAVYNRINGQGGAGATLPAALPRTTGDALVDEAFKERDKANAANEARYQQALGGIPQSQKLADDMYGAVKGSLAERREGVEGLFTQAMGLTDRMGETSKADATRASREGKAANDQSLISRGLFTTTVKDANDRRSDEGLARTLGSIDEGVRGQKAGLFTSLAGARSDLMRDEADATLNHLNTKLGLQAEKRNIIGSKVDEGPNFTDIASYVAAREQAEAQRKGSKGGLFGSLLGSGAGGLAGAAGTALFAGI